MSEEQFWSSFETRYECLSIPKIGKEFNNNTAESFALFFALPKSNSYFTGQKERVESIILQ